MVFEPNASLYPAQPSFHAGYQNVWQNLDSNTASWAFVVSGQFPYSQWISWTMYNARGVPYFTFNRANIRPDSGSVNPFVNGERLLAPSRSYHLYLMPESTDPDVIDSMKSRFGEGNVGLLPALGSTDAWATVMRSYWSFSWNGGTFADYDRFGYGGPTNTPFPTIQAFHTDPVTGALTTIPIDNCGAQSEIPRPTWFDASTGRPIINAARLPRPAFLLRDVPQFLIDNGFIVAAAPPFAPPTPVSQYVQFFRGAASQFPFADVSQVPAKGDPPDKCGGYAVADLPQNAVSLIHVPQLPTYPNYTGANADTVRDNSKNVDYWSMIAYGVNRQIYSYGSPNPLQALRNSELGNQEIVTNDDGSATFVVYPASANLVQLARIAAVVEANGWNILRGGVKTRAVPMAILAIREKGQNPTWPDALSANDVTQGAPCFFSDPSIPDDYPFSTIPADYQVTQDNGMGLSAPNGQNCTVRAFVTGRCLQALIEQYQRFGWQWNAADTFPTRQL